MFRPTLVNGRDGDPLLFVEIPHERDALLLDLGDCSALSARDLLRVRHVCVSHMHVDHFIGFDALLRVNVGREKRIAVLGPEGIIDAVGHRLAAYTWDLAARYATELEFEVIELVSVDLTRRTRFSFRGGFAPQQGEESPCADGLLMDGSRYRIAATVLEHHGPCLAFRISEPSQVNVWPNRLAERGLPVGPWLKALKQAVAEDAPDERPIQLPDDERRLGELRDLVVRTRGHSLGYVTDVRDTPANRAAIAALCADVDVLFIEASFAADQPRRAWERAHLTTRSAGEIARLARARRVEPFHFSPRNTLDEAALLEEVRSAWDGPGTASPAAS